MCARAIARKAISDGPIDTAQCISELAEKPPVIFHPSFWFKLDALVGQCLQVLIAFRNACEETIEMRTFNGKGSALELSRNGFALYPFDLMDVSSNFVSKVCLPVIERLLETYDFMAAGSLVSIGIRARGT
jgi:hypothetical protein